MNKEWSELNKALQTQFFGELSETYRFAYYHNRKRTGKTIDCSFFKRTKLKGVVFIYYSGKK